MSPCRNSLKDAKIAIFALQFQFRLDEGEEAGGQGVRRRRGGVRPLLLPENARQHGDMMKQGQNGRKVCDRGQTDDGALILWNTRIV